LVRRKGIEPL